MRLALKRLAVGVGFLLVWPLVLGARICLALGGEEFFTSCACFLSLFPGRVGSYLRVAYYKGTLRSISCETHIGFGSYFSKREAEVGRNVNIGAYCIIGRASLGDRTLVASRVSIPSGKRQHANLYNADVNAPAGDVYEQISIGSDCWIGEGAVIMGSLGDRCVVSAGSAVTRDIPSGRLLGGNPARILQEIPAAPSPQAVGAEKDS